MLTPADPPAGNLRAEWLFSGNASDSSGNGSDGTVAGAVLVPDRFGRAAAAYSFDRTYITGRADRLPTGERTMSLWFRARGLDRPTIFGYGGGVCGTSWWVGVNNADEAENTIQFQGHCRAHRLLYRYSQTPIGQWQHVAVSTEPQGTRTYFDRVLVASNNDFASDTDVAGKDFAIGTNVGPNGTAPYEDFADGYFDGDLDDIRLYDRALSDGEVLGLFLEGGWTAMGLRDGWQPETIE
jgi:hypothetical protein